MKNLIIGAALFGIYKFLKRDWKETNEYKLGLIDDRGNRLNLPTLSIEQREADTRLSRFSVAVKKILDTNPILKIQFVRSILNAVLMRESHDIRLVKVDGEYGIAFGSQFISEKSSKVLTESDLIEDEIVTNTTSAVADPQNRAMRFMKRRDETNDQICDASRRLKRRKNYRESLRRARMTDDN